MSASQDLWVFGYGSLMWQPGFAFDEVTPARLIGWHRELCIYSHHWRGTVDNPGLVLGLDAGGSCLGVVFRVAAERADATRAYLRERELRNNVYREVTRPVRLAGGGSVAAMTYVADRRHPQYAGGLTREQRLALVAACGGEGGSNREYVVNTVMHLRQLGVRDLELEWIVERLDSCSLSSNAANSKPLRI